MLFNLLLKVVYKRSIEMHLQCNESPKMVESVNNKIIGRFILSSWMYYYLFISDALKQVSNEFYIT